MIQIFNHWLCRSKNVHHALISAKKKGKTDATFFAGDKALMMKANGARARLLFEWQISQHLCPKAHSFFETLRPFRRRQAHVLTSHSTNDTRAHTRLLCTDERERNSIATKYSSRHLTCSYAQFRHNFKGSQR